MQPHRVPKQTYRAYTLAARVAARKKNAYTDVEKARRTLRWTEPARRTLPNDGKRLSDFMHATTPRRRSRKPLSALSRGAAYVGDDETDPDLGRGLSVYIETKGCQMNVSDTEVVRALLRDTGYVFAERSTDADVVLINTCAIREKAEEKVWQWLRMRRAEGRRAGVRRQTFGMLGCMAERLKTDVLERENLVDVVVGPDAYRDLPRIIAAVARGQPGASGYNVQLSLEETYADVAPLRVSADEQTAFVSIMRGCQNFCAFCVVPYTRGRERSRPLPSVVDEVRRLAGEGVREVTLLGQNVNSWHVPAAPGEPGSPVLLAHGFGAASAAATRAVPAAQRFPDLLRAVAEVDPEMRVRFTSPHPQHFPDDVLRAMRDAPNICNAVHMPAQSGSSAVLARMRRRYSREAYLDLVARIRETIPGVTLSTDMISGFCGETEADHEDTLALLREVEFDLGFFFHYSERDKTEAARKFEDDVPKDVKLRRLREAIDTFHEVALAKNERTEIGAFHLVLVDDATARTPAHWHQSVQVRTGRTDGNKRVVFADSPILPDLTASPGAPKVYAKPGDYVVVKVTSSSSLTLFCTPIARTTLTQHSAHHSFSPLLSGAGEGAGRVEHAIRA